jgi:hypothetical protein
MKIDRTSVLRVAPMLILAVLGLGVSCLIACGHAGDGGAGSSESKVIAGRAGYGSSGYGYGGSSGYGYDDGDPSYGYYGYGYGYDDSEPSYGYYPYGGY